MLNKCVLNIVYLFTGKAERQGEKEGVREREGGGGGEEDVRGAEKDRSPISWFSPQRPTTARQGQPGAGNSIQASHLDGRVLAFCHHLQAADQHEAGIRSGSGA